MRKKGFSKEHRLRFSKDYKSKFIETEQICDQAEMRARVLTQSFPAS